MFYYDTHTHLNDPILFDNWKNLLIEFENNWWKWLMIWWVDGVWNIRWIDICKTNTTNVDVKCCVWIHPSEVCENKITNTNLIPLLNQLKDLYKENNDFIVWIWECWIDLHYENSINTIKLQQDLLAMQAELAMELDLPLIVHSRQGFSETLDVLSNYKNQKIYFHCYGYWPQELKIIDKMFSNYYIWFAWNVTFPKAILLQETFQIIDLSKVLIETDAPYLSPQKLRWTTNYPHNVKYIYEYVASNKWLSTDELCYIVEKNYFRFIY